MSAAPRASAPAEPGPEPGPAAVAADIAREWARGDAVARLAVQRDPRGGRATLTVRLTDGQATDVDPTRAAAATAPLGPFVPLRLAVTFDEPVRGPAASGCVGPGRAALQELCVAACRSLLAVGQDPDDLTAARRLQIRIFPSAPREVAVEMARPAGVPGGPVFGRGRPQAQAGVDFVRRAGGWLLGVSLVHLDFVVRAPSSLARLDLLRALRGEASA